ncbi:MAG: magnesium transporter, partial [Candidatus Norongarragalinales archaeon]
MKKKNGSRKLQNPLVRAFHEAHARHRVIVSKHLPRKLERVRTLRRRAYHPLLHEVHHAHKISRKTLFYVKEYGPHSNVAKTIVRESVKILLFASLLSALGGLALEHIKTVFVSIVPLVVLLPALNDMIGDYGAIISAKFSTLLHTGKIKRNWWESRQLRKLFMQILALAVFTALVGALAALLISSATFAASFTTALKVFGIAVLDAVIL